MSEAKIGVVDYREIGKRIARESLEPDRLSTFDRSMVADSVRLTLPLKDSVAVDRALALMIQTMQDCRAIIAQSGRKERGLLLDVRGRIRDVNQKINAYRRIR